MERLTYFDGGKWRIRMGNTEYSGEKVDRISAYEDILDGCDDVDRLRELVEADRDGRCEIHKVKDGEIVYSIFAYVNGLCPKKSNGKPFNTIAEYKVDDFTRNTVDREFGKTVFLTREAAEAALNGDQHGENQN